MLTWREFIALLLAGIWDLTQGAFIAITLGLLSNVSSSLFDEAIALETLALVIPSVFISILLAVLLRPHWALLPMFILENIPLIQVIPNTTAGTIYIIRSRRRSLEQGSS